jgi:hypothetical protein
MTNNTEKSTSMIEKIGVTLRGEEKELTGKPLLKLVMKKMASYG